MMPMSSHEMNFIPTNLLLSGGSALMAFFFSSIDPMLTGLVLPVAFFLIGKTVDVLVRVYLEKKK